MSHKRSLSNPPEHYKKLTPKQQASWRRNTRRMERNEELRKLHPPYQPSSNIDIIHIHRLSTITQIDELISKAGCTRRFIIDTESERNEYVNQVIEVNHLPDQTSILFRKIQELCRIIFNNNNNEIISWGEFVDEIKHFRYVDLIHTGSIHHINLQFLFSNPNAYKAHPHRESRENGNRNIFMNKIPGENIYYNILYDSDDDYNDDIFTNTNLRQAEQNQPISLQEAVATTFKRFLDKSLTCNNWKCGLDIRLNTWKTKLFSRGYYDERLEKHQRQLMIEYAVRDCTSVAEIFFTMFPEKMNDHQTPPETPRTTTTAKKDNDLSDISEDELIEIFKLGPHSKSSSSQSKIHEQQPREVVNLFREEQPEERIDPVHEEEREGPVVPIHEQQRQRQAQQPTKKSKADQQRRRNQKFKWKKANREDFRNFIRRPIYKQYNYLKIRSQLEDDKIYHSHQITINEHRLEVKIGFRSGEELERARTKMKINYFSREQYIKRWCNNNIDSRKSHI